MRTLSSLSISRFLLLVFKESHIMKTLKQQSIRKLTLIFWGTLLSLPLVASAESDMQLQEKVLKAREITNQSMYDHVAGHDLTEHEFGHFRGVFYGYLPCSVPDCDGFKMTLSLKQKNNYLLVTQYARSSSRENYEKGKYNWDDKTHVLTLTSKEGQTQLFTIQSENSLIKLAVDGKPLPGKQSEYALQRSDVAKSRDVHIH
jgi:NlpE N-terminal domain